ncbi:tetratricopeptide repeat protein [Pseudodesulfovibrio sediminis]|uniref:Tetratricopeptide repeat protein n=1 Tax=Pseudodesulfovibrio sediminis TaxID=2810563 RepID=A0ABN6ESI8_9BACT|nr:tetratricopeptide repeat protein [Pseudodesulfovibrio sediminis]BCS88195.1 hypothetical protein PSDVSF_14370 [Pseudodesulfovibrio sediminis]
MKVFSAMLLVVVVLAVAGCAKVMGPYYLEQEKYEEGVRVIGEQMREHPEDASAAYYVGRYTLALDKPKEALPYLEKAVKLDPENADYVFWTGVAYWAMLDFDREKAAYEKALRLDPNHISANLYLGHGYIDRGEWVKALAQYTTVLRLDPYNPEALYNKAMALNGLGRTDDAIAAWKKFLEYYPDGSLAMEATAQLNLRGNFDYRNFIIGKRNVTLKSMAFKPGTSVLENDSKVSLHLISAMMTVNKELTLHIVPFVKGNAALAKERAEVIRDYMLNANPGIQRSRLPLSWFKIAETIDMGDVKYSLDESVKFITEVR